MLPGLNEYKVNEFWIIYAHSVRFQTVEEGKKNEKKHTCILSCAMAKTKESYTFLFVSIEGLNSTVRYA